jgi:hypothetical protein
MLTALLGFIAQPLVLIIAYMVFTILNILDGYTTWHVLKPDNFHREINPVARWLFRKLGIPNGIIIVEGVWIAFYTLLLCFLASLALFLPGLLLLGGILVFAWVAGDGFRLIRKRKQIDKQ